MPSYYHPGKPAHSHPGKIAHTWLESATVTVNFSNRRTEDYDLFLEAAHTGKLRAIYPLRDTTKGNQTFLYSNEISVRTWLWQELSSQI